MAVKFNLYRIFLFLALLSSGWRNECFAQDNRLVKRAQQYVDIGHYPEAIKDYSKAIRINPHNADAYLGRGTAKIYLKEYKEAIVDFDSSISLKKNFATAYNNRAVCKSALNNFKGAIQDYDKAIELNPADPVYYLNRGICYDESLGNYIRAIEDYEKALLLDSLNAEAYNNKGNCFLKLGDYDKAMFFLSKAISLKSNFGLAYNNRGFCRYILGEYELALEDLENAAIYYPSYIYIYNNKANCYFKLNQLDDACFNWRKAIDMGYKYRPEWKALYKIDDPVEMIAKNCGGVKKTAYVSSEVVQKSRLLLKADVRAILLQPRISLEFFLNNKFSLEAGGSIFRTGQHIYYQDFFETGLIQALIGIGPSKGYDYYADLKYTLPQGFYWGMGYFYRYSHFNKKDYTADVGNNEYQYFQVSEKAYSGYVRFTGGAYLPLNKKKSLYLNPYAALMIGRSDLHLVIDTLGGKPADYDRDVLPENTHKKISSGLLIIGCNFCFSIINRDRKRHRD
jgi:tetratricopeptide (TPR) repeat protein